MSRLDIVTRSQVLLLRHLQVFFYSLGQLSRQPMSLFMTAAVIGIALALPTGLHVLLQNAQQISGGWDGAAQISLFLKKSVTDKQAKNMANKLRQRKEIAKVSYVSREQALKEFQQQSGFGDALKALAKNPLPSVLIVQPALANSQPQQTAMLLEELQKNMRVDVAQLDMQWVKRLYAIMDIVRRGVVVLAGLLALAVLLVVGNTIRLAIQNRRAEIVVMKLIGGTDAFIRRPFLYTGFWYGFFGALMAFIMVYLALLLLSGPVEKLTALYHNNFELSRLDLSTVLVLMLTGVMLGLVGSWLAVGRHLRDIEPV
ncbi:Cell-division-associated, ABC-transporter-like signaling protein FtsX [hydrothermal vent metagenome]|uniref:Cell division protein FtsX n=1 Tax=hydrothermal vent metagenome TaxID=652676 RepID=A0A3B1BUA3_9ZZZZ